MNRMNDAYIKEHLFLYVFVTILFLVGVAFGAVLVNELTYDQRQEMAQFIGNYFTEFTQEESRESKQTFWETVFVHLKWIFLIWLFGLSIVGIPCIFILNFLKGLFLGFTVGYFVTQLSWKGMCIAILSLAPHNAILIPAIFICSVAAIVFSIHVVKNRYQKRQVIASTSIWQFSRIVILMSMCVMFASAWEVFMTPFSLRWILPKLGLF